MGKSDGSVKVPPSFGCVDSVRLKGLGQPVETHWTRLAVVTSSTHVRITSPDRLLWPDVAITKQDLIDHYVAVGPLMLEELRGRLLTLVRAPGGVGEEVFFQKNAPDYTPDWIKTVTVPAPSAKRDVRFLICDSMNALLWIANQSGVELHHCLDRNDKPGRPDLLVFDMDPPAERFDLAVEAALIMREVLQEAGLEPLIKTTGGKGLHVYLRIERRYGFDQTHAVARRLAEKAIASAEALLTLEFKKADRGKRVFLDIHRNGPGATLVAPFSPRARPVAPVSFPITWEEMPDCSPSDYRIATVQGLLDSRGVAQWREGFKSKHRLQA